MKAVSDLSSLGVKKITCPGSLPWEKNFYWKDKNLPVSVDINILPTFHMYYIDTNTLTNCTGREEILSKTEKIVAAVITNVYRDNRKGNSSFGASLFGNKTREFREAINELEKIAEEHHENMKQPLSQPWRFLSTNRVRFSAICLWLGSAGYFGWKLGNVTDDLITTYSPIMYPIAGAVRIADIFGVGYLLRIPLLKIYKPIVKREKSNRLSKSVLDIAYFRRSIDYIDYNHQTLSSEKVSYDFLVKLCSQTK